MKILRKSKGRGGFSLAEMLVAVLILSMMSMVACMGITTALQDRARAIIAADAQTVASTAAQAVADQVRYGQINQVGDDFIVLTGSTYGNRAKLCLDSGHLVAQNLNASGNPEGTPYALLGEKAYGGLHISSLGFERAPATGDRVDSVTIKLSVAEDSGSLWSLEYAVSPMNTLLSTGL